MKFEVPNDFKTALRISSNWKTLSVNKLCRFYALRKNTLYLSCSQEYKTMFAHQNHEIISKVNLFLGWIAVSEVKWLAETEH